MHEIIIFFTFMLCKMHRCCNCEKIKKNYFIYLKMVNFLIKTKKSNCIKVASIQKKKRENYPFPYSIRNKFCWYYGCFYNFCFPLFPHFFSIFFWNFEKQFFAVSTFECSLQWLDFGTNYKQWCQHIRDICAVFVFWWRSELVTTVTYLMHKESNRKQKHTTQNSQQRRKRERSTVRESKHK